MKNLGSSLHSAFYFHFIKWLFMFLMLLSSTYSSISLHNSALDDELWPEEAKDMTCTKDKRGDYGSHLNCQHQCEAWNSCVGISITDQSNHSDSCFLCETDKLQISANGFGFHRRPGKEDIENSFEENYHNDLSSAFPGVESNECNHANKAKTLYGYPTYNPSLSINPATKAYTLAKGMLVDPLREWGANGIYAATMLYTNQDNGEKGCSGYFGVQWLGKKVETDLLLFSIWDMKKDSNVVSYALPNHPICHRNVNDGTGTGTQCKFKLPQNLQEKDELEFKIEREPVETLSFENKEYNGHVWTVKVRYASGPNKENFMMTQFGVNHDEDFILGRILFTDDDLVVGKESSNAIDRFSVFHEHISCTPCGSFAFEAERSGPYVIEAIDTNQNLPKLDEGSGQYSCEWNQWNCTCRLFDIKSYGFGKFSFQNGDNSQPHWDDLKSRTTLYWTEGNDHHAENDDDCMDTISAVECDEAKATGSCGNINWASTNCAKTCDLCCDLC